MPKNVVYLHGKVRHPESGLIYMQNICENPLNLRHLRSITPLLVSKELQLCVNSGHLRGKYELGMMNDVCVNNDVIEK